MEIFLLSILIHLSFCSWETEWLIPIQNSYSKETPRKIPDEVDYSVFDEEMFVTPTYNDEGQQKILKNQGTLYGVASDENTPTAFADKLKRALKNAQVVADMLKAHIDTVASQENKLKENIVNGRSGVTVLTVLLLGKLPRTYIIRDGYWTLCSGVVQFPANQISASIFNELFAAPRCIGQEVSSRHDPCVFNSVIKYETIPRRRGPVYSEEDYLCLKPSFNQTLEQYRSVPTYIVNETCRDGVVKRLADNSEDCGVRVLSEYTYYPHRSHASNLPLEYCTEKDGACKLIVAWHISNASIENFEYIKNDKAFQKFFMNVDVHSGQGF